MDNFNNVKDLISYAEKGIVSKEILPAVTLFCMSGGSKISDHMATKHGLVYVIEGSGNFNLQGEIIKMETGVIISMPENAVHSLSAESNLSFILFLL